MTSLNRQQVDRTTSAPPSSTARRYVEATAFILVWMAFGYLLPMGAESYLLLGIPLTLLFQLLVRRRPLRELWVRTASAVTLDRKGWLAAGLLVATPAYCWAKALPSGDWSLIGWWSAAMAGAVLAAWALRSSSIFAVLRGAALPTAVGAVGMTLAYGTMHALSGTPIDAAGAFGDLLFYTAVYFPATFLLEEVTFRGALDSHVQSDRRSTRSALLVSALWGLWHLPVASGLPLPLLVIEVLAWHMLVGLFLSRAWRTTGNLAAPGLAHAAIDAVRNALMVGLA